ncbi:MAG: PTS sugar transporter subunit IIA [Spirochaetales bacterium]|nr:PTS sugar transporter subunit IIA [Spirochaetales bacterium]
MNLKKILSKDVICLDLKSKTKSDVLSELVALLVDSGKLAAEKRDLVLDSVKRREAQMSTGMQEGIAIPHAKTDEVDDIIACIGISKGGIDFGALDGKPSDLFIMTISPAGKTGPHVQFLAEISRLLTNPDKRKRILSATTQEEILAIFLGK